MRELSKFIQYTYVIKAKKWERNQFKVNKEEKKKYFKIKNATNLMSFFL